MGLRIVTFLNVTLMLVVISLNHWVLLLAKLKNIVDILKDSSAKSPLTTFNKVLSFHVT